MSHYTVMSLCGWPQGVSDDDDDDASSAAAWWGKLCKNDSTIYTEKNMYVIKLGISPYKALAYMGDVVFIHLQKHH